MKGKSKRFLSLLTAAAIIITSIPSVFAAPEEENNAKTITGITAVYSGGEQHVGNFINANDVTVTVNYSDESSESAGSTFEVLNAQSTPQVLNEEWNDFTIRYTDPETREEYTTVLKVWGYTEKSITAEYVGEDILIENSFPSDQVNVSLVYTKHSNGEDHVEGLSSDKYTITDSSDSVGQMVWNTGWNYYTVTYTANSNDFTAGFSVWGYDFDKVTANYKGESVLVGSDYSKSDVEIKHTYTPYHDNSVKVDVITDFDVDSTKVTSVGANTFTATTTRGMVSFTVMGYESTPATITGISAAYKGSDVRVGGFVNAKDVEITVHYNNGKDVVVGNNCTVKGVTEIAPQVKVVGDNKFIAVYDDKYEAELNVWGYDVDRIEATYTGSDILTQNNYSKDDVTVTAYWTTRKDGTPEAYTPTSFEVNSTLVTTVGNNTFTASAENKTDDFVVVGYDNRLYVDYITAEYKGADVLVGSDYSKSDVEVTIHYTNDTTTTTTDFDLNSTTVFTDGKNEFTVTSNNKTTTIEVWGYKPASIEAEYNGPDVFVGNMFESKYVHVKLVYTPCKDGTVRKDELTENQYTIVNSEQQADPTVTTDGDNFYTVSHAGMNAQITVWGYKLASIDARYNGPSVRVGEAYNRDYVSVAAVWTTRKDGSPNKTTLSATEYTLTDSFIITKEDKNLFYAYYGDCNDAYGVTGFKDDVVVESITAEYKGADVLVGSDYSKSDVEVTILYSDKTTRTIKDGFDISSLTVSATGDNTYTVTYQEKTADINVWGYKPVSIEAEYNGSDILVGNMFASKDVVVTLTYTAKKDGSITTTTLEPNQYTLTNSKNEASPVVTIIGYNDFTVDYQGLTDGIKVWGYKPISLEATYNGPNILVGDTFAASDVEVKLVYTPNSDNTVKKDTIAVTDCTIKNVLEQTSYTVLTKANNEYTVSYNGLSDKINVWGYDVEKIEATYNGEPVRIKEDYKKTDVSVKAIYSARTDGGETSYTVKNEAFTVDSTLVKVVGDNTYVATFDKLNDTFVVEGFDDNVYVSSIKAEYVGPDILVGNTFKSSDVRLTVYYTNDTTEIVTNGFDIEPFTDGVGPVVSKTGWNDYTVVYQDKTDGIKVWGYEPKEIEAVYNGPDILVKNVFASKDVDVTLIYTPYHDNTVRKDTLEPDQYTLTNAQSLPDPTVTVVEWNDYTVNYQGLTDGIKVWGYELKDLTAKYNGPDIYIGNDYKKADVTVTATYTPHSDGKIDVIDVKVFDVDSLKVPNLGVNVYKATCEYGTAPFTVNGINKPPVKTENTINLVAVDKDNKEVKNVTMKYSTNGYVGTLKTGDVVSAKLGMGTVVTLSDCTITVPDGYEIDKTQLDVSSSSTNTKYTVLVVVKEKTSVVKTENIVKLVATDKDGNVINGVEMKYNVSGYIGTLKTGDVAAAKLGVGTVVTAANCTIGIPSGYSLTSKDVTSEDKGTYTEYTVKVVLTKVNTQKPSTTTDIPQTGDESNAMAYILLGSAALAGLFTLIITKKKEEENE